ncbi:hypothetical protein EVAR_9349_1 [Eumeta japonica]|uniref:Uncharacterized protein n=1 Tax=Eumeta variegata TaxID=151549 RepID=A0A4C1YPE8_EUMVA|nr:hypothetical protein EVAR_9349_1 [Eumeta japonica]
MLRHVATIADDAMLSADDPPARATPARGPQLSRVTNHSVTGRPALINVMFTLQNRPLNVQAWITPRAGRGRRRRRFGEFVCSSDPGPSEGRSRRAKRHSPRSS